MVTICYSLVTAAKEGKQMSGIFDLSALVSLVEKEKPSSILIVDTNVLIDEPDFTKWATISPKPIFVMSDTTVIELEHLKNKQRRPEDLGKFVRAIRSYYNLATKGDITRGILIENIGACPINRKRYLTLPLR
jgi:hypothetical protein